MTFSFLLRKQPNGFATFRLEPKIEGHSHGSDTRVVITFWKLFKGYLGMSNYKNMH